MRSETVAISASRGRTITTTFTRSASKGLAIFLPGLRHSNSMPVPYFLRKLVEEKGFDTVSVDYRYDLDEDFLSSGDAQQLDWIGADARAVIASIVAPDDRRQLFLIGKSLGTIGMGAVAGEMRVLDKARYAWLTPSLNGTGLNDRMIRAGRGSLVVIGTRDPAFDDGILAEMRAAGMIVLVLDGVDHGLEHESGAVGSVDALRTIVRAFDAWAFPAKSPVNRT